MTGPHRVAVPPSPCPECGRVCVTAAGLGEGRMPIEGSISLCVGCGALSVFGPELQLRRPSPAELVEIMLSADWPIVERCQRLIRGTDRRDGPGEGRGARRE